MIKIRRAKRADAREIALLRRKTLREINKNDYPKVFLQFLINENSMQGIINKMKKRDMFCLIENNKIMGVVDLENNKIGGLFIRHNKIGRGYGQLLLDFIEGYAKKKGIKKVRLYSTKFAFSFYKKRGYRLVRSGYWVLGGFKAKDKIMEKILK